MNKSLISQSFINAKKENRPALLTYTVAGDNTKEKSFEISLSFLASPQELTIKIVSLLNFGAIFIASAKA